MGAASRKKTRTARWLWLFRPEDTTAGKSRNNGVSAHPNLTGWLKSCIWIAVSVLVGLVIGQL